MKWSQSTAALDALKCDWVNTCLQVKQGMKRCGIKTIPLTRAYDESERAEKNRPVGADSRAV